MANRYFSTRPDDATTSPGRSPGCGRCSPTRRDDPTSVTRDYVLDLNTEGPPLLSVYGGKLTTYRKLAEDVVGPCWRRTLGCAAPALDRTRAAAGRRPAGRGLRGLPYARWRAATSGSPGALLRRYARAYGTRIERRLLGAATRADLGEEVLPGLHAREIDYLRREEWAHTAEDILYRRSKLALHVPADGERDSTPGSRASTARATGAAA